MKIVKDDTAVLPESTYEEWLKKQVVKQSPLIPERKMPTDFYEEWIRRAVKKRLRTRT